MRPTLLATAVGLLVAGVIPAVAAAPVASLTVSLAPAAGGTVEAPLNTVLGAEVRLDPPSDPLASRMLPAVKTLVLRAGLGLAPALGAFATCSEAALRKSGPSACPAGAQLGDGAVKFEVYFAGSTIPGETDDLRIYRGAERDQVLVYAHVSRPQEASGVVAGLIGGDAAPFSQRVTFDVSKLLPSSAGVSGAVRGARLTLDGEGRGRVAEQRAATNRKRLAACKKKRTARSRALCRKREKRRAAKNRVMPDPPRTVFGLTGCPAEGGRAFRAELTYADGSSGAVDTGVPC